MKTFASRTLAPADEHSAGQKCHLLCNQPLPRRRTDDHWQKQFSSMAPKNFPLFFSPFSLARSFSSFFIKRIQYFLNSFEIKNYRSKAMMNNDEWSLHLLDVVENFWLCLHAIVPNIMLNVSSSQSVPFPQQPLKT